MSDNDVRFPDVTVELIGQDGNVFSVIGAVSKALRRAYGNETASSFVAAATSQPSYDEVLALVQRTVTVA